MRSMIILSALLCSHPGAAAQKSGDAPYRLVSVEGKMTLGSKIALTQADTIAADRPYQLTENAKAVIVIKGWGSISVKGPAKFRLAKKSPGILLTSGHVLAAPSLGQKGHFYLGTPAIGLKIPPGEFYASVIGKDSTYFCTCNGKRKPHTAVMFNRQGIPSATDGSIGHTDKDLAQLRALKK